MAVRARRAALAGLSQLDRHPETVIDLIPMVIAMLRAGCAENLEAVTSAIRPFLDLADKAQRILGMPAGTVEANLAGKPSKYANAPGGNHVRKALAAPIGPFC